MEKAELKPCPFCGGEANHYHHAFTCAEHYICCDECGAKSDVYFTKAEAVSAWNRRAKDGKG